MNRSLLLLALLIGPATVFALGTEQFGNTPIAGGLNFDAQITAAVNMNARVYWYEVNGNPHFFFKGTPKELNEAIRHFAAIRHANKEIILLAGPGVTKSFHGKTVAHDWSLHVPMGDFIEGDSEVADRRATLTIFVDAVPSNAPVDATKVKQWIRDLNNNEFKVREKAAGELAALGSSVASFLQEALKEPLSAEARDRVERVLTGVSKEIRLDVLKLPKDIPVVGVEALLERARKELSNKDANIRGFAASSLSHCPATPNEIRSELEKVLKNEKHEYPLRCAISVANHLGAEGKPLLPLLKELLKSADKNVQNSAKFAIEAIAKAKEEAVPEVEIKKRATIRKEIGESVKAQSRK